MDKVLPCSSKIRLQNPSGKSLEGRDVHCVVVEEGSWTMPDGRKIEAKSYESKLTLITTHLGLVKNKHIQTRTVTPSCWDRSFPTTMPNGPFFGAVALLLIEHQVH